MVSYLRGPNDAVTVLQPVCPRESTCIKVFVTYGKYVGFVKIQYKAKNIILMHSG